jgi:hypothetical protein
LTLSARPWLWATVAIHAIIWAALCLWAYVSAAPYSFASCWSIILPYISPLGFLYLMTGFVSIVVLFASISRPHLRSSGYFPAACHGLLLVVGMQSTSLAAYAAAGGAECL